MSIIKRTNDTLVMIVLLIGLLSCKQDRIPSVFDPNETGNPAPVITGVMPPDYGLISVTDIEISGDNFSSGMDSIHGNTVYIGKEKAMVLSASKTKITVKATPTPGNSLTIKVIVPGAFKIAEYGPYELKNVIEGVGKKANKNNYYAIAIDGDETVYGFAGLSTSSGVIHKFSADGSTIEIGTTPFPVATDMKVGPNGYLYLLYGYDKFYRMNIENGGIEEFTALPERLSFFDFDQNGNIYMAGNKKGIIVTDVNVSQFRLVGDLKDFNIYSLKVFDDGLYIAGLYSGSNTTLPAKGIYKAAIITPEGDLEATIPVFDWENAGDHSGTIMKAITIAENGTILVGTNHIVNPIITIKQDGSNDVLYPGILLPSVSQIVYGTGKFIYQNRKTSDLETFTLYKILTEHQGAPYYGRM